MTLLKIIPLHSGEPLPIFCWETFSSLQSEPYSWDHYKLEGSNLEMCKMLCQHKIKVLVQLYQQPYELDLVVFQRTDM